MFADISEENDAPIFMVEDHALAMLAETGCGIRRSL
jgi:hypothetical protein